MTEETQRKISNLRHLPKEKDPLVYKLYASRKLMESHKIIDDSVSSASINKEPGGGTASV